MSRTAPAFTAPADRLQALDQLIAAGRLDEAGAAARALAQSAPADPRVCLVLLRVAEARGDAAAALEAAQSAVRLAPAWPVAHGELALLLARTGQAAGAMEHARRAVDLAPQLPQALVRMVDVAHLAQDFATAVDWLRRLARLAPREALVQRLLARDLHLLGRHEESRQAWSAALALDPRDAEALVGRLQVALALQDRAAARRDAQALMALDPANADYRFWLDTAEGRTPQTQPEDTVRRLFDGVAPMFDANLVQGLGYRLPQQVAERLQAWRPARDFSVLDLGCGTGLLGRHLGRLYGRLVGVDVSPRMLEQAARLEVYDELLAVGMAEGLARQPDRSFDVVTALDVLVYVGDLAPALPDLVRVLRPGGRLVLSCESAGESEADLVLRPSLRYAHRRSHVQALCAAAGFEAVEVEDTVLRTEHQAPVHGFVLTAGKPL